MGLKIFLHPKAKKYLDDQDKAIKEKIKNKIKELKENPERGKRLKYTEFRKLRIGNYRVIYEIKSKEKKIIILFIGHRKNVYDDFSKMI